MTIAPVTAKAATYFGKQAKPASAIAQPLAQQASDTFTKASPHQPIETLGPLDIHTRPDSLLAKRLRNDLKTEPVVFIRKFSPIVHQLDEVGSFHWYEFGRKLIRKIFKTDPDFVKNHDLIVVVNRKSTFEPDRNELKTLVLKIQELRSKKKPITKKSFNELSLESLEGVVDDATMAHLTKGDFYYALISMPKGTFSNEAAASQALGTNGKLPGGSIGSGLSISDN